MDKIQIIEKLFYYIVTFSYLLLPLLFLLLSHKRKETGLLAIYGSIVFVLLLSFSIFEEHLSKSLKITFVSSYTTIEYCFFAAILYFVVQNTRFRKTILFLSFSFIVFQVVYFFTGSFKRLDSIPVGVETILMLIYVFFLFSEYFKTSKTGFIYNHYGFWIAIGIMIYLGGTFFFNILIDHLTDRKQVTMYLNLTYIPEFLKNILFGISIFVFTRNPIETNSARKTTVPYLDMI